MLRSWTFDVFTGPVFVSLMGKMHLGQVWFIILDLNTCAFALFTVFATSSLGVWIELLQNLEMYATC